MHMAIAYCACRTLFVEGAVYKGEDESSILHWHRPVFLFHIMSTKVIAVAGASGYVGVPFMDAFLQMNAFEIRVLTRASSVSIHFLWRVIIALTLFPD